MKTKLPLILLSSSLLLLFFACQDPALEISTGQTDMTRPVSTRIAQAYFGGNQDIHVTEGQRFFLYLGVNLGNKTMGAFEIDVQFDTRYLQLMSTAPPWVIPLNSGLYKTKPGQYWTASAKKNSSISFYKTLKVLGYSVNGVTSPNSNGSTPLFRLAFKATQALPTPTYFLLMRPRVRILADTNARPITNSYGGVPDGMATYLYITD